MEDQELEMNTVLAQDIESVKEKFGEDAVSKRQFSSIGDVDVELHLSCDKFEVRVGKMVQGMLW